MPFRSNIHSEPVADILSKYPDLRLPLLRSEALRLPECKSLARAPADHLFPGARDPKAAQSGLLLLLGGWEESHRLSQDLTGAEGSYWHAIVHRLEPDYGNAGYWYRRVGVHPIYADLQLRAAKIASEQADALWPVPEPWDPAEFLKLCEAGRVKRGGWQEHLALGIQQAEWECLFSWCATAEGS